MTDDLLAEQVAYYRRRAGEYDETAYGDVAGARERIARIVAEMAPRGDVLEIACGTGLWTEALAAHARSLTALDAAPETVAIARERVRPHDVTFEIADVFTWTSPRRYDVVFFSAWLSHVPDDRFDNFWNRVARLLTEDGRVLFVDEPVESRAKEDWSPGAEGVVRRRLNDGTTFRIVKNFLDPARLHPRLHALGWTSRTWLDGADFLCGEARTARAQPYGGDGGPGRPDR